MQRERPDGSGIPATSCEPLVDCPYEAWAPACNDGEVSNGYWAGIWWVPELISKELWWTAAPLYSGGRAVWYAEGVMEATAWLRWEWGQIPLPPSEYLDGVSLISPADIGKTVWINGPLGWEGPFIVVDCAQWDDEYWIVKWRKEVVEVGWETKERWGISTPIQVEVVVAPDAYGLWRILETHAVVDYPAWWLERAPNGPTSMAPSFKSPAGQNNRRAIVG